MKLMIKVIKWIIMSLAALIILLYITDTDYLIKAVRVVYFKGHTTASIDDYVYFDNSTIKAGSPKKWPLHKDYNKISSSDRLMDLHRSKGTVAFMIIKNDSIFLSLSCDLWKKKKIELAPKAAIANDKKLYTRL